MNKKQREIYINLINGEINKFEEKNIKEKNNLTEKIASSLSCYYQGYGKSRKVKEVYFLESIELLNNLEKDITNEFDIELLQELRIYINWLFNYKKIEIIEIHNLLSKNPNLALINIINIKYLQSKKQYNKAEKIILELMKNYEEVLKFKFLLIDNYLLEKKFSLAYNALSSVEENFLKNILSLYIKRYNKGTKVKYIIIYFFVFIVLGLIYIWNPFISLFLAISIWFFYFYLYHLYKYEFLKLIYKNFSIKYLFIIIAFDSFKQIIEQII